MTDILRRFSALFIPNWSELLACIYHHFVHVMGKIYLKGYWVAYQRPSLDRKTIVKFRRQEKI